MLKSLTIVIAVLLANVSYADLVFHHPIIQPTVPGIKVSSVYATIENTSNKDVILKSYQSSAAKHVELHESTVKNSRMVMRKMDTFTVKANDTVALKPGSYHFMLIGLHKRLKAGDLVDMTLTDTMGKSYQFKTTVMDDHRSKAEDHSHHGHHKMKTKMDHSHH